MKKRLGVIVFLASLFLFFIILLIVSTRTTEVVFLSNDEKTELGVLVAKTPEERETGLMFVEFLPADEGMLFVFPEPMEVGFWMKNTLIPLDMFFVDSKGMIITIRENVPPCRADPCPLYSSDGKILYTIETNAGYAKLHGLKAGSRVIVPNVQAQ